LDGRACSAVGLTAARLLADGLNKTHVQALMWPLSAWEELFGITAADVEALGIKTAHRFFSDDGHGPAVLHLDL